MLVAALEEAVATGVSTSVDPRADSIALFASLHGVVTAPASTPGFGWLEGGLLLDRVVTALAHLVPGR